LKVLQNKHNESFKMACNWTKEEVGEIAKKYAFLMTVQRLYGEQIDISTTLKGWSYILGDYKPKQIIDAMDLWVRNNPSMPTPSDIIKIIEPKKSLVDIEIERTKRGGFIC